MPRRRVVIASSVDLAGSAGTAVFLPSVRLSLLGARKRAAGRLAEFFLIGIRKILIDKKSQILRNNCYFSSGRDRKIVTVRGNKTLKEIILT